MALATQESDMKELSKRLERDIVVFDLETTGTDVQNDQIIQFHATRINKDGKTKELTFLCKPTCDIHPKASEVNGYTAEKLEKHPRFSFFVKKVLEFFKDADIAGYNNDKFDNIILNRQMEENGVKGFLDNRLSFDAYQVYNYHINKKLLGALAFYCGEENAKGAHDAKNDVGFTIQVINAQLQKENCCPEKVVGLIQNKQKERQQSELSRYLVKNEQGEWVLNFSKNKGIKLSEVDKGFLSWVVSKEFPQALKDIIREYVK